MRTAILTILALLLCTAAMADMDPKTGQPYELFDTDAPDTGSSTPDATMPPNNCLAKFNYNSCMGCAARLYEAGYLDRDQAWELAWRCYAQKMGILTCDSLDYTPAELQS